MLYLRNDTSVRELRMKLTERKRNDLILVAILIIIPAIIFTADYFNRINQPAGSVVISIAGVLYTEVPLDENIEIRVESNLGVNLIKIEDGSVRIIEATCPDRLCISHSPIQQTGEQIVCLPNKVVVEIKRKDDRDIDSLSE